MCPVRANCLMKRITVSFWVLVFPIAAFGQERMPDEAARTFFESRVRPVLANRCFQCHGPEMQKGRLRVDSLAAILRGSRSGHALQPGKPDESLLVQAIRHDGLVQMPPKMKLPAKEIADLTAWVRIGSPWPDAKVVVKIDAKDQEPTFTKEQVSHWAFQPVKKAALPTVKNASWVRSPIDAFILTGLEKKGLPPAPRADARTLIRRVYFDLIGLPPPVDVVEAFVKDCDGAHAKPQAALAKVVDELLASPRSGLLEGRRTAAPTAGAFRQRICTRPSCTRWASTTNA